MSDDYDRAMALQNDLLVLATELAGEISVMPSRRDTEAIRSLWAKMCNRRSRLNQCFRAMRAIGRAARTSRRDLSLELQRKIARETRLLNRRLNKWDHMGDLVSRHIDPAPTPLINYPEVQQVDRLLDTFHMALFDLVRVNEQSPDARGAGCFSDIPMPIRPFEMMLRAAYRLLLIQGRADAARFLDVGCGGGTKVLAASVYFPDCQGLEYDATYVAAAQDMFRRTNAHSCSAFQGDGRTFENYDQYDVIYFYRPMREDGPLIELENQVFETARPGTVILAPYTTSLSKRVENERPQIGHCVFLAGMDQAEQDAIKYEAERTDTQSIDRSQGLRFDAGFWQPLFDAATFNGQL